jgi:hypothetical protein
MKEELNKDMENLKKQSNRNPGNKSPFSQIKKKYSGKPHSRLEQREHRISEVEDKIEIKEKTQELFLKQLKSSERNMQEHTYSIKITKLRTMGIEEGEEMQAKGIHNIFNKIIAENSPSLKKELPTQVQEPSRTPNRLD